MFKCITMYFSLKMSLELPKLPPVRGTSKYIYRTGKVMPTLNTTDHTYKV